MHSSYSFVGPCHALLASLHSVWFHAYGSTSQKPKSVPTAAWPMSIQNRRAKCKWIMSANVNPDTPQSSSSVIIQSSTTTVADEFITLPESYTRDELKEKRSDPRRIASLFYHLASPYWAKEVSARWNLAKVVALSFLQAGVSVGFSYVGRDFWNALSSKDIDTFQHEAMLFFVLLVIGTPISVLYTYSRDSLALSWRKWLTDNTMNDYFRSRNYYKMEAFANNVDNPDQRIAEDLKGFTETSLFFFLALLSSAIDLVAFSFILFSIYPRLFVVLIGYAGFGTFATTKIGKSLVNANFKQLQKEADFRYSLVRVRENAESVAFYQGEQQEFRAVKDRLDLAVENFGKVIRTQRNLEFFTTGYKYLIQVLPALVVAPLYFQGSIGLGVVSQSFSSFNHILNDLSIIINRFEQISRFSAGIDRLGEFMEQLKAGIEEDKKHAGALSEDAKSMLMIGAPLNAAFVTATMNGNGAGNGIGNGNGNGFPLVPVASVESTEITADDSIQSVCVDGFKGLQVSNLSLTTPDGSRRLVQNLSFTLKNGERLLIVGPSGTGKSSLLRAIAGLWTCGKGTVIRPPAEATFFLPQKPYNTLGTLRTQMLFPSQPLGPVDIDGSENELDREDYEADLLLQTLRTIDLSSLAKRMGGLDTVRDWSDILSLGEQQRLAFGRLLLNRPELAIIDEGSSALDEENQQRMYNLLIDSKVGYISVGHRPSLRKFHDYILRLQKGGAWSFESCTEDAPMSV